MRITENIALIGSGRLGMQLSHSLDCNVYLLDGGSGEYAMIDAGGGLDPQLIVSNIRELGVSPEQIKHILITHAHGDHAAGAAFFQQNFNCKVVASTEAKPWIEQADRDKFSLNAAIRAGVYPADFQLKPCPVHRGVNENDEIRIGTISLKVIHTPGHAHGHISFLMEEQGKNILFAGDTVFAGGKIVLQNIWDCSIQEYAETLAKLSRLHIDSLFPGHGPFLLTDAWQHIDKANDCFERLEIPPNL